MLATVVALCNAAGLTSLALRGKGVALMRRILVVLTMALVMAALMLAMAMPAFASHQGGAAGECGPPGQSHQEAAKEPGESTPEAWGGKKESVPPGQSASEQCAPGHNT